MADVSPLPFLRGLKPFHILTKPIGPICNLDCKYCFYLEKENLYPDERRWSMSDEVLEAYIRKYIEAQPATEVSFAWQGGEPTLLGIDFYQRVLDIQKRYANGKSIHNAVQTNGTLLDDEWCAFLSEAGFLVGLSIDGPRDVHDRYRLDKQQKGTFDRVMRGLGFLKKHKTTFNTLTVVSRANQDDGLAIYRFLKELTPQVMQFIPLVEREPTASASRLGMVFAEPPTIGIESFGVLQPPSPVTAWSVEPAAYGEFLCSIFDHWVRNDVGKTFVQLFDVMLGVWSGLGSTLCVFSERCGRALAVEHNGDLYSCDHYVYPQYKLGNLLAGDLVDLVGGAQQKRFGDDKHDTLPNFCRNCDVRFACNGECPKHRFIDTPDGEPGLNYLCEGYKRFFRHIDPQMRVMALLLSRRQPAGAIMELLRQAEN